MGLSLSQKILRRAGAKDVRPGAYAEVTPDWAMTYDPQAGALHRRFAGRWGGARFWDPERVVLVADHFLDIAIPAHRDKLDELDAFARAYGIRHYYPVGAANHGVCHALMPEEGLVRPGELIVGTDSHSSTAGGFGGVGLNVGIDAMEGVLATGRHWLRVPRVVRIEVAGALAAGVTAKDVALKLCADFAGAPQAFGAAIELDGDAIQALHPEEKLTIANMAQEMGARWLSIPANAEVCRWVAALGATGFEPLQPDPDADYAAILRYRGADFSPMIALPGGPERAAPIGATEPVAFNEVFIGSCTGAKRIDMEQAFAILTETGVAPGVTLFLAPATRRTRDWLLDDPARRRLIESAGVRLADQPGCNACAGIHGFIAGPQARRLSTGNRNYAGRMGAAGAEVYLGSAATAARVAATGRLSA